MRKLLYLLILFDFIIRPFAWKIAEKYLIRKYSITDLSDPRLDPAYKIYWISDCASYALLYLLVKSKDKLANDYPSQVMIWGMLPFAGNKLFESIFFNKSNFDWTEIVAILISAAIVIYKINLHKYPKQSMRNWYDNFHSKVAIWWLK